MFRAEIINPEWKIEQKKYKTILETQGSGLDKDQNNFGLGQIELREIGHVDRCITCHLNPEQTVMDSLPLPFAAHPVPMLDEHDLGTFACTLCHSGSGRSLLRRETCDKSVQNNWKPVESSCVVCHLAIFDKRGIKYPLNEITTGWNLFRQSGCLGCHKLRGLGGPFGPDLTSQGEKILQGYNFNFIQGKKSIVQWHHEHFTDPGKISPGSIMPKFSFNSDQIDALIILILGFSKPHLPMQYYSMEVIKEFKEQRDNLDGNTAYAFVCSSCHAMSGTGRTYDDQIFGVPALANKGFQSVASLDMISFMVQEGRSNRYMPAWRGRHSGLREHELSGLIEFVREWRKKAPTFTEVKSESFNKSSGEIIYQDNCATCHRDDKSGAIGPSLNSRSFLAAATDRYLYETMITGRSNTAMPSWSYLSASYLKNLIRYLQPAPKFKKEVNFKTPGNAESGKMIFHYQCSRCHGPNGMGGIGPAILNRDFLSAAGDHFIIETIRQGRNHTPMFSIKQSPSELTSLIAFMRASRDSIPDHLYTGPTLGNPDLGKNLFRQYCSECHGNNGEGLKAPALHNEEFLNAATNGFLLATITIGREGTPMPVWGRSEEKHRALNARERHHLVAFIRQWQTITIKRDRSDPIYKLLSYHTHPAS
jgi:mono/diheme cytochrome c family protein